MITKREILASISIMAVMIMIGIFISSKISEYEMDRNEKFTKAVKIENTDLFQHGMDTNVGNAFVYGELKAVDYVTYPEIDGQYMYIKKVKEKYTMHTKTVTKTRVVNGKSKSYTTTETYWTWDEVDRESKKCEEVTFCGITFNIDKFDIPTSHHIDTIKESSRIRYKYYGVDTSFSGTIFTELKNNTISDNSVFYEARNIDETVKFLEWNSGEVVFWIIWIVLIVICVFIFFYADNKWLE